MATTIADMSMSLDGFVAGPDDRVNEVFAWMRKGEDLVTTHGSPKDIRVDPASAAELREAIAGGVGALITGRRLFDIAHGWSGQHPVGAPVFVVTHRAPHDWQYPDAPVTFVTDGVASAVARASVVAGERIVAIASPTIAQQCLNEGLLDAIRISLVPVLLGEGVRLFEHLSGLPIEFDDHPRVTPGTGVTHLFYRVRPVGSLAESSEGSSC